MAKQKFFLALQYVSLLIMTLLIIVFWINEVLVCIVILLFFWLFIPLFLISILSFVLSLWLKSKHHHIILTLNTLNLLLIISYFLIAFPNRICDAYIMEEHYEKYKREMESLIDFTYHSLNDNCGVVIEFDYFGIDMFHILPADSDRFVNYWADAARLKDSLMQVVGLDEKELEIIRDKLDDIGCLSIEVVKSEDSNCANIGFRRVGFGKYDYCLYYKPLTVEKKEKISEMCTSIVYNDSVVFVHGTGVFGSDCFFGKEEYTQGKINKK